MKKPYVKKYSAVDNLTAWIVDGTYIRNHVNVEFTNFGQHYRFSFIPRNELWVDREYTPGEIDYFIEHMCIEHELMSRGMGYEKAFDRASEKERRLRKILGTKKGNFYVIHNASEKEAVLDKTRVKLLKKYSADNLQTWIVSGEVVRNCFLISFTEGGHDKVYPFVPTGEVWIDDDLFPKERKFVLLHELHERQLMAKGMSYAAAHARASALEYKARRRVSLLEPLLKRELFQNKKIPASGRDL